MSRVLIVDNFDSFTYNLVQELGELSAEVVVVRNDCSLADLDAAHADGVIVSPGPCTPTEAGISIEAIHHFAGSVPVLGVCLGHQAIAQAYGGEIVRAPEVVHGKTSAISHRATGILAGLDSPVEATRYHSLVAERASLPDCLDVTAETPDGLVMGLRHRELSVEGVQFHPESILTDTGMRMLATFLTSL